MVKNGEKGEGRVKKKKEKKKNKKLWESENILMMEDEF